MIPQALGAYSHAGGLQFKPGFRPEDSPCKGAPAIECRTYSWLVSLANGPKKKKMEVLKTKAQEHSRTSY